jgi:hypothetical protein
MSLWPVLAIVTIGYLARNSGSRVLLAWVFVNCALAGNDAWARFRYYAGEALRYRDSWGFFSQLPEGGSVGCDDACGAWIANRRDVVRWPHLEFFDGKCPALIVLRRERAKERTVHSCIAPEDLPIIETAGWAAYRTTTGAYTHSD